MSVKDKPAPLTKIMYVAMVNYNRIQDYLEELVKQGLITYDGNTRLYSINPKGKDYLYTAERLHKLLELV